VDEINGPVDQLQEEIMTYSIGCKDVGMDCDFKAEAQTEEELLKKVAQHAKDAHGMTTIDAATLEKLKSKVKKT
jgi:predicted small metal-binding protein